MSDKSTGETLGEHGARLNAHDKLIEKLEAKLDKIFYAVIIFAITQLFAVYNAAPQSSNLVTFIEHLKP